MGRFSTTLNVKCANLANVFTELMKKRGFESCKEDEATLSYLVAQGGEWATCACSDYNGNPRQAGEDADLFTNELKTPVIFVEVVDSDFAILRMNGDEVIAGDGSGYGIEDAPKGSKNVWEPLLVGGTFEELTEIWGTNEVFVEDALCKSAPLLGIDPKYICANHRDLSQLSDDKNITTLCFKKIGASKPMTLNAAFKKMFGEGLEPLGFKLVKSKYPYFVKVVSNEIIHYVTIANETADGRGAHGVKYKCFDVYCGVSTVYNGSIDFNKNHFKFGCSDFIDSIRRIYAEAHRLDLDWRDCMSISPFYYNPTADTYLISAMEKALSAAKKYALPVIEQVVTLEKCADYFRIMNHFILPVLSDSGETLLCSKLFSADEYVMFMDMSREREIEECRIELDLNSNLSPKRRNSLEERIKYIMEGREEAKKKDYQMFINLELQEKVPAELERRKAANTELLRSYGFDL